MCKKFIKNRRRINYQALKKSPAGFWNMRAGAIMAILLLAVMAVYYLGLINDKATAGYKISELEAKANDLAETNRNLELQVIALQQTTRIEQGAKSMDMVQADNVGYLTVPEERVAVR